LVLVVALAGVSGLVSAASGATAGDPSVAVAAKRVYFEDAAHEARVRPKRIRLEVGAGALFRARRLNRWLGWGRRTTRAHGRLIYNTCDPFCAAGNYANEPGWAKLSRIRRCGRRLHYTRVKLRLDGSERALLRTRLTCEGDEAF
jgi:hypothetical protein